MIKRQGYKYRIPKFAKKFMEEGKCPACGLHKDKWKRRIDWRCCSVKCTNKYERHIVKRWWWKDIRDKALKRDNYSCVKCGKKPTIKDWNGKTIPNENQLIGDHVIPIALGGEEFDIDNVQTLCIKCDKEKTKLDHKDLAKQRSIEKNHLVNKTLMSHNKKTRGVKGK